MAHDPACQRPRHSTLIGWRNDPARYDVEHCAACADLARLYDLLVVGRPD